VHNKGTINPETDYYYQEDVDKSVARLGRNVKEWMMGRLVMEDNFDAATDNPVEWWALQEREYPEISSFAMFLLSCPVQSASCERIFKNYSAYHTKKGTI
jgi:hypothetical protein